MKNMEIDYQCHFDLDGILKNLGLDEKGMVQQAIDSQFLMGVEPYVPFLQGYLIGSGVQNTQIGSGQIVWDVDNKARRLYYGDTDGTWHWSNNSNGLRGSYWAERYIQNGGRKEIEDVARRVVGK